MTKEEIERWPQLPFETRMDALSDLVSRKLAAGLERNPNEQQRLAEMKCNRELDELFLIWENWEPSSPCTFGPLAFNAKPIELKLRLLQFALDTYTSCERLLRTTANSTHPNLVANKFLKERREKAANFLDALTFEPKP